MSSGLRNRSVPSLSVTVPADDIKRPTRNSVYERYGWQSDFDTFTSSDPRIVRRRLQQFLTDASQEQVTAWDQCIPSLQTECRELTAREPAAREYTAILEYELPRDFRRPDVIILESGCVVVIEFKGLLNPTQAALDQALGYARDLAAYHAACAGRTVVPVLVTRGADRTPILLDKVYVVGATGLDSLLARIFHRSAGFRRICDLPSN